MSKVQTPNFSGEWVGQIANFPNKLKFEKTTDSDIWVGMVWQSPVTNSGDAGKWILMQNVEFKMYDNKLNFTLSDGGNCECYASDYMLSGAYFPAGMATQSSPLGFQLGRTMLPNSANCSK